MSKKKQSKQQQLASKGIFLYDDHRYVTRRDFLSAGIIKASAAIFAPTLYTHLIRPSIAEAACGGGGSGPSTLPAFVQLNLSGGAMLGANFVPRDRDGNLLADMSLMGLGGRTVLEASGLLVNDFGTTTPSFVTPTQLTGQTTAGGLLPGIRSVLTAGSRVLGQTAVFAVVAQGRDDSDQNELDITGLVAKAGLKGDKLPGLSPGDFNQAPTIVPPPTPLIVNSFQDIASAVGVVGPLFELTTPQRQAVFSLVKNLSASQALDYVNQQLRNTDQLSELIGCATDSNVTIAGADLRTTVDPRLDGNANGTATGTALTNLWQIAGNTPNQSRYVFAASIYNALKKYSGPVRLQLGGYDYHNSTRTLGNDRDFEAGQAVGRALQTADILGQPLYLVLTTDGATRSDESATMTSPWVSDRGQASVQIVFVFHPTARPATGFSFAENAALEHQIGYIKDQSADSNYIQGWNAEKAGAAIFANYMAWAYKNTGTDWRPLFTSIVAATNPFSQANSLDKVLRLA
jgi:hypothetical protein